MSDLKIVIPDGHTLNPGDLDYSLLAEFGDLEIFPRSTPEELLVRAKDADILIGNKIILGETQFRQLPRLKYVGLQSTGYNVVDVAAAARHGVTVTNVPAYSTDAVVQNTFAHLLNITYHLGEHTAGVRAGRWTRCPDFCYWDFPPVELAGKTLGLIGFGNIAKGVARVALMFRMKVIASRHTPTESGFSVLDGFPGGGTVPIPCVSREEIFGESDVVSLHCPMNAETAGIVSRENLARMRRGAILINTARGGLVDERALADALNESRLAGAGLDVLSTEPPAADNPLLTAKNCFITPHLAWGTLEARRRCLHVVVENVRAFLAGKPRNVVS